MYEDLLYGMIKNRELKKYKKLNKTLICRIILPNGNKDKESRWSKLFHRSKQICLGDIDGYLTTENQLCLSNATAIKLQIKNIRERKKQNKNQTKKMPTPLNTIFLCLTNST